MNDVESLSGDQIEDGEGTIEDRITKTVRFKEGGGLNSGGVLNIDLELEDGDILRSVINGIPGIEFSDRIKKILVRDMESAVVVKLLGRNIGYGALYNRIVSLWKPSQPFRLMDAANGYYLVKFQSMVDYEVPWMVDFDPSRPFPNRILAWIRFPDTNTDSGVRGQFACIAVVVDLEKPLTSLLRVNGRLQRMKFEALPEVTMDEAFGPWMVVERKSRRKLDRNRGSK
ncbi:hypothetical protein Gorai_007887, partial [Gossypium raimondii]|nr:hypothetical protein [Gossypium raimondii]